MTTVTTAATDVALAYHRAWAEQDMDRAMSYVDEGIVCEAPAGVITGHEAFRGFMGPFAEMVESTRIIAAFGDEDTALVMYDTTTQPVPHAPGAEFVQVRDGRITRMQLIFDRAPFEAALSAT